MPLTGNGHCNGKCKQGLTHRPIKLSSLPSVMGVIYSTLKGNNN